jgi:AbrB family looped-hinge helix DNA binding protein
MKEIPTTLKVDTIGRVMLPKHIRDKYNIAPGDLVTILILVEENEEKKSEGINPCEAVPSTLPILA